MAGDGRVSIAARSGPAHDLVMVDAFSSDAIPIHLLTREALAVYRRALTGDGIIAFHVSNRFFDLLPVVGRLAEDAGLLSLGRTALSQLDGSLLTSAVVVGIEGPTMVALRARGWVPLPSGPSLWTDDRADVLGAR